MTSRISELLSAAGVRAKADEAFARAEAGALTDWRLDLNALDACADYVAAITRERYPDLAIPFHARWRHFVFDGRDLWAELSARAPWKDAHARARAAFDLAISSVLLDAGAGPAWRYRDAQTGLSAARSEGLALASLRLFQQSGLAAYGADLRRIDAAALAAAFQASQANPLAGLEGRARLLARLGAQAEARPDLFALADAPRPGGLYDALRAKAEAGALPAAAILETLLEALGPIWEGRPVLDGAPLGDCWPHPELGFAPLHKLSQWLAYSLIEPLEEAGVRVTAIEALTGLAEYRNGGLFVDTGVLIARDALAPARAHAVSDPFIVGWRTLTVALLDRLAPLVGARLGLGAAEFPLARLLEGGAWAAGRAIAREKRADGGPPFIIHSDGTVF